ncbi:MAG: M48 family metallopeptidase [Pseudomonadota bacterium]
MRIPATYYNGSQSQGDAVTLHVDGEDLIITLPSGNETFCPLADISAEPPLAGMARHLTLYDGSILEVEDHPVLDHWLKPTGRIEAIANWLEQRWPVALGSVAVTAVFLWALYAFALPATATAIAHNMPQAWSRNIADATEELLLRLGFGPTEISQERQEALRDGFAPMIAALPDPERYTLEFRKGPPKFGPNAFALPGGRMMVLDDLVKLTDDDYEILGVLAHELGHAYYRHPMRGAIQLGILGFLAAVTIGDTSGLASIPLIAVQASYSREFETEADAFAAQAMRDANISPDALARMFERLRDTYDLSGNEAGWFASHPALNERIKAARDAAK